MRYNFVAVYIQNLEFSILVKFLDRLYLPKICGNNVIQLAGTVDLEDKIEAPIVYGIMNCRHS